MTIQFSTELILQLAPHATQNYLKAFEVGEKYLEKMGISESTARLSHFLAQVLHETGQLRTETENLNYSAQRLVEVWPSRFKPKGPNDPNKYAKQPEKLANLVYGGRMGNITVSDGWRYRGRSFLQTTGKSSYESTTRIAQRYEVEFPDLVKNPDLILQPEWSLLSACAIWTFKGCNQQADGNNIVGVTKLINGGDIGLYERRILQAKVLKVLKQSLT